MKISSGTLSIFKNFATINEGIYVKAGNVIETVSKQKNILARAEVEDTFEEEFGIYDLNNFLGALSMVDPDIEFDNKQNIVLRGLSGRSRTNYRKANKENILLVPDKKVNMDGAEIHFNVTAEDLVWVSRAASQLGSPNMSFVSDGEKIGIETFDSKDDSASTNHTTIGDSDGKRFRMVFSTENLRMIPGNYDVSISSRGIGHFKNAALKLEYWITTEPGSKYEG